MKILTVALALISTYANAEQTQTQTQLAKSAFCYAYAVKAGLPKSTVMARAKEVSDWQGAQFYFGVASANVVNLAKSAEVTEKFASTRFYLKKCKVNGVARIAK